MGTRIAAFASASVPAVGRALRFVNGELAGRCGALLAVFGCFLALASGLGDGPAPRTVWQELGIVADSPALRRVVVGRAGELEQLFTDHGYQLAGLNAGEGRGVPRLAVNALPRDMARLDDIEARKSLFLRSLLPLVLQANRELQRVRDKVMAALDARDEGRLAATDGRWLDSLVGWYGATPGDADDLLSRIDAVPPSLALAQAAQESGWGTSRFALGANALFGQRSWGATAIGLAPREAADEGFKVRAFPDLMSAVRSYLHNLNSHPAYQELRDRRARARALGAPLHALELVGGLENYSEDGTVYIAALRALIRSNRLMALDGLRLR